MSQPTVLGIVVARLDSSRLPGKALIAVRGRPLIDYVIERARAVHGFTDLVLATTDRAIDAPLCEYAAANNVPVFRGDYQNIARRMLDCATQRGSDYFLRLNGDSPFLDPALVDRGIRLALVTGADFVTNLIGRTFPYGISVEVINTCCYSALYPRLTSHDDREHMTRYLYLHMDEFRVQHFESDTPELAHARLVVDTEPDLARFKNLAHLLGDGIAAVDYERVARLWMELSNT